MKPAFFKSAAHFRDWLQKHHGSALELHVGFYRKASGVGITYSDALDEALSFGWIDGVRKRINAQTYAIRFTPRQSGSAWSAVNLKRAQDLISRGLMKPAGLRVLRDHDQTAAARSSSERSNARLDPALDATLRADRKASSFFDAQPQGYRKLMIYWVMSAKKQETRVRRLAHLIDLSATGARIDPLHPNRRSTN